MLQKCPGKYHAVLINMRVILTYSTVAWLIYINVDDHRCTILEITWSIPSFIPVQLHAKLKIICSLLCPETCLFTKHSSSNACIMVLLKITFVFHSFLMYCICHNVWCAHYGRLGWVLCYQGHFWCYSLLVQSSWKQKYSEILWWEWHPIFTDW